MDRVINWDSRIMEEIGPLVGSEFVWGKTDCACVLRKAMTAMHGEDVFVDVPKIKYRTLRGAAKMFKKVGSIEEIIKRAGGVVVQPQSVIDGDIAVDTTEERFHNVAVRVGSRWIVSNLDVGIVQSRRSLAIDNVTLYRI